MKTLKKWCVFLLLILFTTGMITGCQELSDEERPEGGVVAERTSYELVIGHINSENHTWHKMAQRFKELVEEKTEDKVLVTIYEDCKIGSEIEMIQEAIAGTGNCDIVFTGESMNAYVEELGIIGMPYAIANEKHLDAVLNGEIGQELSLLMKEQGLRVLGSIKRGNRYVTANKRIKKVSDMKDMLIRTPESDMTIATFEAFGATTVPMAFSDIYDAIDSKMVEGQENTLANIYDAKLYEVQKYVMNTAHLQAWVYFAISEARFSSFPEEIQLAITQAAEESIVYEHELFLEKENSIKTLLVEEGMEFVDVNQKKFKEQALSQVVGTLTEKQKELYDKILLANPDYKPTEEK